MRALALFALLTFAAVVAQEKPAPAASAEWDRLVSGYIEGWFKLRPHAAVMAGRHEFDGQLPDFSRAGIERSIKWLKEQKKAAERFDAAALDERRRFERDHLIATVDGELFWLETAEQPWRNPLFYGGPLDPAVYLTREYAPLETRMRAYVRYAGNVPRLAQQARANLRTPLPRTFIEVARLSIGGLAGYYEKDVPGVFAEVKDQKLRRDFRRANAAAAKALRELDAWFQSLEKTATEDYALGEARFQQMLWATERVDTPLAELRAAGERDLERNLKALDEACAQYAPGKTRAECMLKMQGEKAPAGPVAAARRQLESLRQMLVDKDLVSIPGPERALVEEAPPYQRWNSAYIDSPGPYDKHLPSIYYIAPPDPAWSKEDQLAYVPSEPDLLFTSVHEVWPGHFLHGVHSNRAPSKFGQIFLSYAYTEGWAHYAEEMMWEAGLGDGDPAVHIGQLSNALLRNIRYVCAIGLHTGGMSVAECERLFREKGLQDPGNARQQAARGTFDPAYLNYTMGKLMIRKLREQWTATRGGRKAWRQFHDEFLSYGGPPVPMVRKAMLGADAGGALF
jgi:hypothetical protein